MAGRLSPSAAIKVAELESFSPTVARLNGLVETYAATRTNPDALTPNIKRAAEQLKRKFLGAGLDQLSQLSASIAMAASRAGSHAHRVRTLRELVGSLKFQLELSVRTIIRDDEAARSQAPTQEE